MKTEKEIIDVANIIHNNRYDYSLSEYKNLETKMIIKCEEHGIFEKTPRAHINGKEGCPLCKKKEMNNYDHNLIIDKNFSYLIGLFQTDGSMYQCGRNRGRFTISLSIKDEDIIYKIKNLIPYNSNINKRFKKTRFEKENGKIYEYNKEIIEFRVSNLYFRNFLLTCNIPYGKKSKIIEPPLHLTGLSKIDYIRGLFDGDGSLGFTADEFPFVGFITQSEKIKDYLLDFISEITYKERKTVNRNKRDNLYNIMLSKEDAIKFCELVYYENCLSINRKYEISRNVISWIRPEEMKKRNF